MRHPCADTGVIVMLLGRTAEQGQESTATPTRRLGRVRLAVPGALLGLLSVVVVIGIYWLYTARPGANEALTPPPPTIVETFLQQVGSGELISDTVASLRRVCVGFVIGTALAILLGCAAGWFRVAGHLLNPLIDAIRPIPALAYIPLVIVWLGIGEWARITIIILAVFKPCVVNTRQGMKEVPNIYVEAAESLGASKHAAFWRVGLPSSLPFIMAGTRTGLATGFLALVAAELIAASDGLGFLISNAGQNLRIDIVFVGIIAIGIIATLLDAITVVCQRRLTRWSDVRR